MTDRNKAWLIIGLSVMAIGFGGAAALSLVNGDSGHALLNGIVAVTFYAAIQSCREP